MASFYLSDDDWKKGEEILLMDNMNEMEGQTARNMAATMVSEVAGQLGSKMLYVYDFLRMWIFYIDLVAMAHANPQLKYPLIALVVGDSPSENEKNTKPIMEVYKEIDDHSGLNLDLNPADEEHWSSFDELTDV